MESLGEFFKVGAEHEPYDDRCSLACGHLVRVDTLSGSWFMLQKAEPHEGAVSRGPRLIKTQP